MEHEKHSMDGHPERQFHHAETHKIPVFIRLAWTVFFIAAVTYIVKFSIPDLKVWLAK